MVKEELYHFSVGTVAGMTGMFVVFPIDSIKTRLQNQREVKATSINNRFVYNGYRDCATKVVRFEGFRALYGGWGPACASEGPKKALRLTLNDWFRSKVAQPNGEITFKMQVIAGAVAGASDVVITNPFEMAKVRMQLEPELTGVQAFREIGFRGLFTGINACFLRDIPYSAIYFPAYSTLKDCFTSKDGSLSIGYTLLAGFIAAIPAAGLTTPADVIKTRMQAKSGGELIYKGVYDAGRRIYSEEGFKALWKGAGLRCLRTPPQFAVTMFMYEWLNRFGEQNGIGKVGDKVKTPPRAKVIPPTAIANPT